MGNTEEAMGINHPSQQDWGRSWYLSPSVYQKDVLRNRYRGLGEDALGQVIDTTSLAVVRMENMRQMNEHLTVGGLRSAVPDFSSLQYEELAGNPDRIVDFMVWFAGQASQFYERRDSQLRGIDGSARQAYRDMSKLGLDLGGVCQAGDWENTSQLDRMIRAIPSLAENNPDIMVDVLEAPEDRRVAFRYEPVQGAYGQIRRRRAVANVKVGSGTELLLFKESSGLLLRKLIDPQDMAIIDSDPQSQNNTFLPITVKDANGNTAEIRGVNNTVAAITAGRYFERAIKERGENRAVLPLGAHYVMLSCLDRGSQVA